MIGDAVVVLIVAVDQDLMTSRSVFLSSVKSVFTETAPFWNAMMATRSAASSACR